MGFVVGLLLVVNVVLAVCAWSYRTEIDELSREHNKEIVGLKGNLEACKRLYKSSEANGTDLAESLKVEISKLRAELESDDRLRGLQERNSALLDENRTLRLRVEQMDESVPSELYVEYASRHDNVGVIAACGGGGGATSTKGFVE